MEFLKTNRWKILNKFIVSVIVWGVVCGVYFLSLKSKGKSQEFIHEEMNVTFIVVSIFASLNFLVRLFANQYVFYKERRLTRHLLSHNLFDDNIYSKGLL